MTNHITRVFPMMVVMALAVATVTNAVAQKNSSRSCSVANVAGCLDLAWA